MNGGLTTEGSVHNLVLELAIENKTYTVLFADEQRAITIGSAPIADVVLRKRGVASLHFHIERENGSLWVLPAYGGADLQVNSTPVVGQHQLTAQALIEFAGLQLRATVSANAKSSRSVDAGITRHVPTMAATVRIKPGGAPESTATSTRHTEASPTLAPAASQVPAMPGSVDPHCTTALDRPIFRQVNQCAWLSRLGVYSLHRPLHVWLVGTAIVFLTAGTTAWVTKRIAGAHSARASEGQRKSLPRRGIEEQPIVAASPSQKLGESSRGSTKTDSSAAAGESVHQASKPVEIVAFLGGNAKGDSAVPNGQVADAVNQLMLGRYADAMTAYAALIGSDRQATSLQVIVGLLERKLGNRCATQTSAASGITCPEVIP